MTEEIKSIDVEALKALVRTVPDFPKPGILFYDLTTLQGQDRLRQDDRRHGGALSGAED